MTTLLTCSFNSRHDDCCVVVDSSFPFDEVVDLDCLCVYESEVVGLHLDHRLDRRDAVDLLFFSSHRLLDRRIRLRRLEVVVDLRSHNLLLLLHRRHSLRRNHSHLVVGRSRVVVVVDRSGLEVVDRSDRSRLQVGNQVDPRSHRSPLVVAYRIDLRHRVGVVGLVRRGHQGERCLCTLLELGSELAW